MLKLLDKVLVVDVESTCWEGGVAPHGQSREIIEIGVAVIDVATLKREEKRSVLVKPEHSYVSAFCTKLTTIQDDDLRDAISLAEAATVLVTEFKSKERLWASWGDYDLLQFRSECGLKNIEYPFGHRHLNIKTLDAVAHGLTSERGMAPTLRRLGLPLEGTHHRGGDDAWNIAGILCKMLHNIRG